MGIIGSIGGGFNPGEWAKRQARELGGKVAHGVDAALDKGASVAGGAANGAKTAVKNVATKEGLSTAIDFVPVAGSVKAGIQLVTGRDLITGAKTDRMADALGLIPVPVGRAAATGVKVANKVLKHADDGGHLLAARRAIPEGVRPRPDAARPPAPSTPNRSSIKSATDWGASEVGVSAASTALDGETWKSGVRNGIQQVVQDGVAGGAVSFVTAGGGSAGASTLRRMLGPKMGEADGVGGASSTNQAGGPIAGPQTQSARGSTSNAASPVPNGSRVPTASETVELPPSVESDDSELSNIGPQPTPLSQPRDDDPNKVVTGRELAPGQPGVVNAGAGKSADDVPAGSQRIVNSSDGTDAGASSAGGETAGAGSKRQDVTPDPGLTSDAAGIERRQPRLGLSQGQRIVDQIHSVLQKRDGASEIALRNSTTAISQLPDGRVLITRNSDTVPPRQREKAIELLTGVGFKRNEILFNGGRLHDANGVNVENPYWLPRSDRSMPTERGGHAEQKGMAGIISMSDELQSEIDKPIIIEQWSSSGAGHGGAACEACRRAQAILGPQSNLLVINHTGFQALGTFKAADGRNELSTFHPFGENGLKVSSSRDNVSGRFDRQTGGSLFD